MADQKRWFKLWCSAPSDDDLLALPPELRWAWAVLGCYTKQHGTDGAVKISPSNVVLAAQMGVSASHLLETIILLPHLYLSDAPIRWPHGHDKPPVCAGVYMRGGDPPTVRGSHPLEEWCGRNGGLIVTWKNWNKYQEDTTAAQRGVALRSKRRGEENKNKREITPSLSPSSSPTNGFHIHVSILEALDACPHFAHVHRLRSAAYWQAQITAYNTHFPTELRKAEAWLAANPTRAPHKDMARFLSNWFAKAHEEPAP